MIPKDNTHTYINRLYSKYNKKNYIGKWIRLKVIKKKNKYHLYLKFTHYLGKTEL